MKHLLTALLGAQGELPTLPKDSVNPHFRSRYTSLDTIVEKVGPVLNRHGLVWTTWPTRDAEGPALRYQLAHAESGESLEDTIPLLLAKADPQGQGSGITYARRYAICAVLNLVADEDDDGNGGSAAPAQKSKPRAKPAAPKPVAKPRAEQSSGAIPAEAVDAMLALYVKSGWQEERKADAPEDFDPNATLRMQLAAVGAGNQGAIRACFEALTREQFETVWTALADGAS